MHLCLCSMCKLQKDAYIALNRRVGKGEEWIISFLKYMSVYFSSLKMRLYLCILKN